MSWRKQRIKVSASHESYFIQCHGWLLPSRHKRLTPWFLFLFIFLFLILLRYSSSSYPLSLHVWSRAKRGRGEEIVTKKEKEKEKKRLLYGLNLTSSFFPFPPSSLTSLIKKVRAKSGKGDNVRLSPKRRWKRKSFVIAGKSSLFCLYILLLTRTHHQRSNKISFTGSPLFHLPFALTCWALTASCLLSLCLAVTSQH